jgi:hypothetical protein
MTIFYNSTLEMLQKTKKGDILVEEGAMEEGELEAFKNNEIGGVHTVKNGAISGGKIKDFSTQANIAPYMNVANDFLEKMKYLSGIRDNAMGQKQSSNESGVAVQARVAQTDIMQEYVNDNAQYAIKLVAKKLVPLIQKYMTEEQVLRIIGEDGDEQYLVVNQQLIDGVLNDITMGEYDIEIAKAPYGRAAKNLEFQKLLGFIMNFANINPMIMLKSAPLLIKSLDTNYQKELLEIFAGLEEEAQAEKQQQQAMMQQQEQAQQMPQQQAPDPTAQVKAETQAMKSQTEMQKAKLDLIGKQMDLAGKHAKHANDLEKMQLELRKSAENRLNSRK